MKLRKLPVLRNYASMIIVTFPPHFFLDSAVKHVTIIFKLNFKIKIFIFFISNVLVRLNQKTIRISAIPIKYGLHSFYNWYRRSSLPLKQIENKRFVNFKKISPFYKITKANFKMQINCLAVRLYFHNFSVK